MIDSEGGVWEARRGSIDGPVAGDATGGNQGFTQLVCLVGDFNTAEPSDAAKSSLVLLLAWLADRYEVSTAPGTEVTFTSRGSNKWPSGTVVTTPPICGHRDMSETTCPGENLYPYVAGSLIADVESARGGSVPVTSTTTSSSSTTTTTTTLAASSSTIPPRSTTIPDVPSTSAVVAGESIPVGAGRTGLLATAGALVVSGAGLAAWRYQRLNRRTAGSGRHKRDATDL